MAAKKNNGSKSDQIRTLLSSGMAPADIAKEVGCSRNLVYVVKAKQGGTKKGQARSTTAPKSKVTGRSNGSNDLVEQFLGSMKELQRERDELRGVVDKIRQLLNGLA